MTIPNDVKNKILDSKLNNNYIHIPNSHDFLIDWNEYISILEKIKKTTGSYIPEENERGSSRYMYRTNIGFKILRYEEFDYIFYNISNINDKFKKIFDLYRNLVLSDEIENSIEKFSIKMISNLVGDEGGYWIHPDPHDVVTFQMLGNVEYRIYDEVPENMMHLRDNSNLKYKSYILKPGDMFFMTAGTIHQAVVSEPRITAILDIDKDIWDINPIAQ